MPRDRLHTRTFWHACMTHFTGGMSASMFILFPLYVRQLGGTEFTIGAFAGLSGAAAVAVRWPVGHALDRVGRLAVLRTATALYAATWLAMTGIGAIGPLLAAAVVLHGLVAGTLFATYFTIASDIVPASRRSEGMAMFGVWGMLPNGLGPALGEYLIRHGGFRWHFAAAAAFAATSCLLASRLRLSGPQAGHAGSISPGAGAGFPLARLLPFLAVTFLFGLAVNSLFTFLAPFVHEANGGTASPFFLSYAITAVAVRIVGGHLPDRLGPYRILVPALASFILGIVAVAASNAPGLLVLSGISCGVGHGYAFPILTALVITHTPPAAYGMAVSLYTAMFDLGNTVGGPLLGAVARAAGYRVMFLTAAAIMSAAAVLAARLARRESDR